MNKIISDSGKIYEKVNRIMQKKVTGQDMDSSFL